MIRPRTDTVFIEPLDAFSTGGLIVLPEAYDDDASGDTGDLIRDRNRLALGRVLAFGPGTMEKNANGDWRRVIPDLEVGERVMYDRASAIQIAGEDYLAVREDAIVFAVYGDVEVVLGGLISK